MRVRFAIEGGLAHFPGLARPVEIDLDRLPAAEAEQLRELFERVGARAGATLAQGTAGRGADRRLYRIELEGPQGRSLLEVEEPLTDADLQRLVRMLEGLARRLRRGP